ncbi:MAG: hypothetical protein IT179_20940 [Acidobacteria bacterium]|nr:hypothetical protein [Acidobacteriota bacterium]
MSSRLLFGVLLAGLTLAIPAAVPRMAPLMAQGTLAQLGLTDARARTFLFVGAHLKARNSGRESRPVV